MSQQNEVKVRELKFPKWPGNEFDFSDKELFQIHEDLCEDLEIQKYSESDIVKISVGIWAGLRFAQIARKENARLIAEVKRLKDLAWNLDDFTIHTRNRCSYPSDCVCGLKQLRNQLPEYTKEEIAEAKALAGGQDVSKD